MTTRRMTVGQALAEFLAHQWTVDGDIRERTIPAVFGIFGHGNVAGLGQALKQLNVQQPELLPYHQARNEGGLRRVPRAAETTTAAARLTPASAAGRPGLTLRNEDDDDSRDDRF